jgi:hypothetical protein
MKWQRRKTAHNKTFHIKSSWDSHSRLLGCDGVHSYPEEVGNSFLRNIGTYGVTSREDRVTTFAHKFVDILTVNTSSSVYSLTIFNKPNDKSRGSQGRHVEYFSNISYHTQFKDCAPNVAV